jgi:two-component system, OmpR family, sensor histidine kinase KdpD
MNFAMPQLAVRVGYSVLRCLGCIAIVGVVTWVGFAVFHVNSLIAAFAHVLVVLIVAARWGLPESLVTSVAAMLFLDYFFLPPVLSLTISDIADPQNWASLCAFMVTAVTASKLSASAKNRASEAQARRIEVECLYQLSLALMSVETTKELGAQIAADVRERFGFDVVAFCDAPTGKIYISGAEDSRLDLDLLRSVAGDKSSRSMACKPVDAAGATQFITPVMLGCRLFGSLGVVGRSVSEPALQAVSNLAAVALEHADHQIAIAQLEVARQNERFRGAMLDSLAHDYLTPLASIKGAISTVRAEYWHEPDEEEFLAVVEEESDKLAEMTTEITDAARIEPGKPRIKCHELQVEDLLLSSVDRMKNMLRPHRLEMEIGRNLRPVNADPEMVSLALRQLLGNAAKYSPPESNIEIKADEMDSSVVIRVRDHGAGIPADELESIFERFYRGKQVRESIAGTGMGLSIARDIICAHDGRLWVENVPDGGAQFCFTLPIYQEAGL